MEASTRVGTHAWQMAGSRLSWARALLIPALAMVAMVGQQVPASATTVNPYSGSGYDASYPQCTATSGPSGFGIVGVGHGRPFTTNSCSGAEWRLAGSTRSLYLNTGYAGAYQKDVTAYCHTTSGSVYTGVTGHQNSVLQVAWAIGCSEVDYAVASVPAAMRTPAAWWADIETGNSWSTNTTDNQFAVNGIVAELHAITGNAIPVGVYSSPSMWDHIVGTGYSNRGINADWQAGLSSCSSTTPGFTPISGTTLAPLWLAQSGTTSAGGATYDVDTAC